MRSGRGAKNLHSNKIGQRSEKPHIEIGESVLWMAPALRYKPDRRVRIGCS